MGYVCETLPWTSMGMWENSKYLQGLPSSTRWAPTSYKWSYSQYEWSYNHTLITGRSPPTLYDLHPLLECHWLFPSTLIHSKFQWVSSAATVWTRHAINRRANHHNWPQCRETPGDFVYSPICLGMKHYDDAMFRQRRFFIASFLRW